MNTKGKKLAITGSALLLGGPLFGLMGTIIGMLSAFQTIGSEGSENSEALASDIGFSLITTSIGLCVGIIGGIIMLVALFIVKYRAPWFFWYYAIVSTLGLFNFPVGTILGSLMLVYLITHREEFKNRPNQQVEPTVPSEAQIISMGDNEEVHTPADPGNEQGADTAHP